MTNSPTHGAWSGRLSDLSEVTLDAKHAKIFEIAAAGCRGTPMWDPRKRSEFHEFLAITQVSGRIRIEVADLGADLRILFELKAPVPTRPVPGGEVVIEPRVLLALVYPEEILRGPVPGYALVSAMQPRNLFLANVAASDAPPGMGSAGQAICLGPEIAAGTPLREIVLRTFGALTMQSVQLDERDAAGVMNREAAAWWIQNRDRMPLTRRGFLEPENPEEA